MHQISSLSCDYQTLVKFIVVPVVSEKTELVILSKVDITTEEARKGKCFVAECSDTFPVSYIYLSHCQVIKHGYVNFVEFEMRYNGFNFITYVWFCGSISDTVVNRCRIVYRYQRCSYQYQIIIDLENCNCSST